MDRSKRPLLGSEEDEGSDSSEREHEDTLEIFLKTIKTIPFELKKTKTIGDVKTKFQEVGGIPPNFQQFFYAGKHLKDDQTLVDCDISRGSTLHIFLNPGAKMQIFFIQPWMKKATALNVMPFDTIRNVKAQIYSKSSIIPLNEQQVLYDGILLEDSGTLAAYNVQNGSTLDVIQVHSDIRITVTVPNGKRITLRVKNNFTVLNVLQLAKRMGQTLQQEHRLIYDGIGLEDYKTLSECRVEDYSNLLMVIKKPMKLFVETEVGETVTLNVYSSNTAIEIMGELESKVGVSIYCQRLVFAGRDLPDDRTLADCDVEAKSTLHLIILEKVIFIETLGGQKFSIGFRSIDTLESIKKKIRHKFGFPIDQQRLIYKGKQLLDGLTLADYHIGENSIMTCLLRLRGC